MLLTLIARVADGLPLAEGLETDKQADLDVYKQQAKALLKKLAAGGHPPPRLSLESGPCCFQCVLVSSSHFFFTHANSYVIERGVCYLTLVERSYPKKLAYQASHIRRRHVPHLLKAVSIYSISMSCASNSTSRTGRR